MDLQQLLDAITSGGDLPALLAGASVSALESEARQAFRTLRDSDQITDDDLTALDTLAQAVTALRTEAVRRADVESERQARVDALSTLVDEQDEAAAAPVEGEQAAIELAGEPEGDGAGGDSGDGGEAASVTAAAPAPQRARVSLADIARRAPAPVVPEGNGRGVLLAAADVPNVPAGHRFATDAELGSALESVLATMPTVEGQPRVSRVFATLRKDFPDDMIARTERVDDMLKYVGNEARLKGGSLVAAGGWCAPSEIMYDIACERETLAAMYSLPEMVLARGGIRWTQGPDFSAIWTSTGFFTRTEAQMIAGVDKPCFEIPCPTFLECRLDALGVCLTSGILQERGYPEVVARFIRGVQVAHARRYAAVSLARVAAASTLVALPAAAYSATVDVLGAIELQIWDYRYKHRMDPSATLEVVAPLWLLGVIRSDVAKRNGYDDPYQVTDAEISAWFRLRGAQPQWVYDWQDAFVAGEPNTIVAGIGGATPPTAWPQTVDILLYAAGTWVRGTRDIITIGTLYDSALLRENQYQALFTEDALCVIQRCPDSRLLRIPLCASGTSGAQAAPVCATTV